LNLKQFEKEADEVGGFHVAAVHAANGFEFD